MKVATPEAYKLFHDGVVALSQVEANGIRIDVNYLEKTIQKTDARIKRIQQKLRDHKIYSVWRRRFGQRTNLGSRDQLAKVLFEDLGYKSDARTATGKHQVNEEVLMNLELGFLKGLLKVEKLKKMRATYLGGIQRELVGDRAHCVYNLHTAVTYRSSSDSFNFQNLPVRDPEQSDMIRRCFIPSSGNLIVETDYSQIEVRVAACYNKDPVLLEYIEDKTKDMHRDMASQCYKIRPDEVTKPIRHAGKNQFVFPQFYGDFFIRNAQMMWASSEAYPWVRDNFPKGLGECDPREDPIPGTFEYHMKGVEKDFWERRFKVYNEWKKIVWKKYLKRGWLDMYTGFVVTGVHGKNDVQNYPIQGAAFHCLLWSLVKIQRLLRKYKMKAKIVGQIHDSLVADVPKSEMEDYLQIVKQVMTEDIRKSWKWIITTLEVEAEASDQTWFHKQEVPI